MVVIVVVLVTQLQRVVDPATFIVTGDITDAKTPDHSGSGQYQEEWEEYDKIVKSVLGTGGGSERWLDIRGNHDTFDVPSPEHRSEHMIQMISMKIFAS